MSWHDRSARRGATSGGAARLRLFLALAPAFALAGCLHPLYGTVGDSGGQVVEQMKQVQVATTNTTRLGHYLEDELIFDLNGTGSHVPPRYKLAITTGEGVGTPLVDTVTGLVTAATVTVTADYVLTPMDSVKPIARGKVYTAVSYDRTTQRFSDMRAGRDAEQRAARVLADQIRTEVAVALSTRT